MWLIKNLVREILAFDSGLNLIAYLVLFLVAEIGFTLLLVWVVPIGGWTPWLPIFAAFPAWLPSVGLLYLSYRLDY